jgi:hypothetical protein
MEAGMVSLRPKIIKTCEGHCCGIRISKSFPWALALLMFVVLFPLASSLAGQTAATGQGVISGVVADSKGVSLSGATVTISNVDTKVSYTAKSNDTGYYEVRDLNPGTYEVAATASGFEQLRRTGIILQAGQNPSVDLKLSVGSQTETIVVNGGAPLIETQDVSIGQVLTSEEIQQLPNGTSSLWLAMLAPGVQSTIAQNFQQTGGSVDWNGNGQYFGSYGRISANEFSLDGAPNNGGNRNQAINPTGEEIGQVGINITQFDSSVGHTYGVSVTQVTKSGTNDLHGGVRYRYDTARWAGMQHFQKFTYQYNYQKDNCSANPNTVNCKNDFIKYGWPGTHEMIGDMGVGGPVFIPKLFDGRNKLFFFVGVAISAPNNAKPATGNVPTAQERTGDFSDLIVPVAPPTGATAHYFTDTCGTGANYYGQYQLYNPYSVTIDSKGVPRRTPFCGNKIPSSMLSQNALVQFVDSMLPNPTSTAVTGTNYNYMQVNWNTYREVTNRYDYAPNESNHIFMRWTRAHYTLVRQEIAPNGADRLAGDRWISTGAAGWSRILSSNTVLELNIGATQFTSGATLYPGWSEYKPSDLGLPTYMDAYAGSSAMAPVVVMSSYTTLAGADVNYTHWRSLTTRGNLTSVHGSHSMRAGVEWRQQVASGGGPGNLSGTLNFDNTYMQQNNGTDGTFPSTSTGLSFASLLLGVQSTASASSTIPSSRATPYYGIYAADTWRVRPNLTIVPGVRYEFEYGPTEKHNNQIVGWDPNAQLSIAPAAQIAYQATLASLTAAQRAAVPNTLNISGGPIYAGVNGASTRQWINNWRILPRIGAAYQARPNTVLRAGYGLYYDTLDVLSDNATIDNDGYSSATGPVSSSTSFGTDFVPGTAPLSNPFPISNGTRFVSPVGNSLGADYYAGNSSTSLGIYDHNRVPARSQRGQFSVDHQFGSSMSVQLAYVASKTTDITLDGGADSSNTKAVGYQLATAVPGSFFTGGTQPNSAMNTILSANVPNPFYIGNLGGLATSDPAEYNVLSKSSYINSKTIQLANLVRPYPQMAALRYYKSNGTSEFQEFQANASRRMSNGLVANVAFQANYQKDRDYYANAFDARPSLESSNLSAPWRLTASGVYTLPFGQGRKWAQRGLNRMLFGGFILSGTFEGQPGNLLTFNNMFYVGSTDGIQLKHPSFNDNYTTGTAFIQGFNVQSPTTTATTTNSITTCTYSGIGFVTNSSCQPNSYNLRVFPTHVEGVRQQGLANYNGTLTRTFHPQERATFETRVDLFNVFNHQRVGAANVSPTNAQFGEVTSDNGNGRAIVFQGLLRF